MANAEDLFAAALLQDMAVPLLAKELPTEYEALLEARMGGKVRLSDLEKEQFGWSHADASALMARNWSLPDQFVNLIENHTDLEGALRGEDPGVRAVALSALLPTARDPSWNERSPFLAGFAQLAPDDAPPVADVFASVDTAFGEFAPILKLAIPAEALVDALATEDVAV